MITLPKILFITSDDCDYDHVTQIKMMLEAGCKWIQLRAKNLTKSEVKNIAEKVINKCSDHGCLLTINDHVDISMLNDEFSLHIGNNDEASESARSKVGDKKIIGGTANTFEDIQNKYQFVDYIGLGPFKNTTTKKVLSPVLGAEGFKSILSKCGNHNINTPIVAIGGIEYSDIEEVMQTGVHSIAISGAIIKSKNPIETFKKFNKKLEKYENIVA